MPQRRNNGKEQSRRRARRARGQSDHEAVNREATPSARKEGSARALEQTPQGPVIPRAELADVELTRIVEPATPARAMMDEGKLAELCESIAQYGLLQPIRLIPRGSVFEIESGHRRFLAHKKLNLPTIRALILPEGDGTMFAARLHENIMREEMSVAEEALYLADLWQKHGFTEDQLCQASGRSAEWVGDRLRLLREDPDVFKALLNREINFAVARELNRFTDEKARRYYLPIAIAGGHNSRTVAGWRSEWTLHNQPEAERPAEQPAPTAEGAPQQHTIACCICGGYLDPYNLVTVYIHKWELEGLQRELRKPHG